MNARHIKYTVGWVLILVVGLALFIISKQVGRTVGRGVGEAVFTETKPELTRDQVFRLVYQKKNKNLPQMIDKQTRADSLNYKDDHLFYYFTMVETASTDANTVFVADIGNMIKKRVCKLKADMPSFVTYTYRNKIGDHIATYTIDMSSCM